MACHAGRASKQLLEVCCHSVQGQHVHGQQEGPDISRLDSALQRQWDHAANAHLGNIDIKPYSGRKVWWICDQCPDRHLHSWSATVDNRSRGSGCPQCSGHKMCKHNSLATKAPEIAAQWDLEANEGTPDSVVAQSNHSVGWLCGVCGHKWTAPIDARVSKGTGCPHCAGNAKTKKQISHPSFAGQEHSWSAQPFSRTGRSEPGCPFCVGTATCKCNSLQAIYPGVAAEWDHSKDSGQPSDYTASSNRLAWWSSPQRGSWQQAIYSRPQGLLQEPARLKRNQQRRDSAS